MKSSSSYGTKPGKSREQMKKPRMGPIKKAAKPKAEGRAARMAVRAGQTKHGNNSW